MNSWLQETPFAATEDRGGVLQARLTALDARASDLRANGALSPAKLRNYYGVKRFEQVAESNAIEGSTLSVRETELAITAGVTIEQHNPQFIADARSLDRAHARLLELADQIGTVDSGQVNELHSILLEGQQGAGMFRSVPVRISGAAHTPPETRELVTEGMVAWSAWSAQAEEVPALLRSAVLHAWLAHIHPFVDGNGRTARAIGNLELIRAGFPPVIVRKVERARYYDALALADTGNLSAFLTLIMDRSQSALNTMSIGQEDAGIQEELLAVWHSSVSLIAQMTFVILRAQVNGGDWSVDLRLTEKQLDVDDFWAAKRGLAIPNYPIFEFVFSSAHGRTLSVPMLAATRSAFGPGLIVGLKPGVELNPVNSSQWQIGDEIGTFSFIAERLSQRLLAYVSAAE